MLTIEEQIERLVDAAMDQLDRNPAKVDPPATGAPETLRSVRSADVAGAGLDAGWGTGDFGKLDSLPTNTLTLLDREPTSARPTTARQWPVVIAAAAIVLMVVAALVLVGRDEASGPQVPVAPPGGPSGGSGLIALSGRSGESGFAEIYVVAPDGTGLRALTSTPYVHETAPAWSPDGTRLAFLRGVHSGSGELVVIDPATGEETFSADIPNPPNTDVLPPAWSPDGRLIVLKLANWPGFMMVDLATGSWTTITGGLPGGWSPDGKWFVFHSVSEGRPAGALLVPADLLGTTDLDDVANLPGVRLLVGVGGDVTWMPDSSAVAMSGADSIEVAPIEVVTIADGQRRTLTEDGAAPTWSPDGSHIAYVRCTSRTGGSVWVSAADGTGARAVATSLVAPTWSPGGSLLTLVDADGVFTVRPDGTGMTRLAEVTRTGGGAGMFSGAGPCEGDNQFFRPVWQPGATEAANTDATETSTAGAAVTTEAPSGGSGLIALAGSSGESRSADIYVVAPDGTGLRALTSTPGVSEMAPAWSPDGTRLAFLRGGELVVVDPATGNEALSADIPNRSSTRVMPPPRWSPDGRLIVLNLANCGCFLMVDLETGTWHKISGGFARGWSPDGKWFAFESVDVGRPGLFLVPADLLGTTDLDDVTNLPGVRLLVEFGGLVTWMPDSSAVAIDGPNSIEVVTIADGQRRTLIEDGEVPSWSPDGSHIAFRRCLEPPVDLSTMPADLPCVVWVAAADGTGARAVAGSIVAPIWSPGGRLLTAVDADGVFTVRPDGTGVTRLAPVTTPHPAQGTFTDFAPVWQPGATEAPVITDSPVDMEPPVTTAASATTDG
jgi:Tol biopolymer transport system component